LDLENFSFCSKFLSSPACPFQARNSILTKFPSPPVSAIALEIFNFGQVSKPSGRLREIFDFLDLENFSFCSKFLSSPASPFQARNSILTKFPSPPVSANALEIFNFDQVSKPSGFSSGLRHFHQTSKPSSFSSSFHQVSKPSSFSSCLRDFHQVSKPSSLCPSFQALRFHLLT